MNNRCFVKLKASLKLQRSLNAAKCEPFTQRGLMGLSRDSGRPGISWVPIEDICHRGLVSALYLDGPALLKQEDWATTDKLCEHL